VTIIVGDKKNTMTAFTYSDLSLVEDWRNRLVWPIDTLALREQGALVMRKSISFIEQVKDDLARQVLIVGLSQIVNRFQALSEAAMVASASEELSFQIVGGPPELAALTHDAHLSKLVSDAATIKSIELIDSPRHALLRQVARTHSYTPWYRMPRAMMALDGLMVSHNNLLIQDIRQRGKAVRFVHAVWFLSEIRKNNSTRNSDTSNTVSSIYLRDLLKNLVEIVPNLNAQYQQRLLAIMELEISAEINKVEADVVELHKRSDIPQVMWSGTNGAYPTRLIASEVVRRNGEVNGFDHGGVTGITQLAELTSVVELLTTTSFTVATPKWKDLVEQSVSPSVAKPINRSRVRSGGGEPTFRAAFRDGLSSPARKPRVIYVGHPYRGLRQFAISAIPDSIYWDFQERLVAQLLEMPVDLLCKPHPEGFFRGATVPIQDIAPTSYKRFEEHLDDADVFLFDAPTSTTFMEALCTRRRVVLIDRGHYPFSAGVKPHALERCVIVRARCDDVGRMSVDKDELADALLAADLEPDPTWFRNMLTGHAA